MWSCSSHSTRKSNFRAEPSYANAEASRPEQGSLDDQNTHVHSIELNAQMTTFNGTPLYVLYRLSMGETAFKIGPGLIGPTQDGINYNVIVQHKFMDILPLEFSVFSRSEDLSDSGNIDGFEDLRVRRKAHMLGVAYWQDFRPANFESFLIPFAAGVNYAFKKQETFSTPGQSETTNNIDNNFGGFFRLGVGYEF